MTPSPAASGFGDGGESKCDPVSSGFCGVGDGGGAGGGCCCYSDFQCDDDVTKENASMRPEIGSETTVKLVHGDRLLRCLVVHGYSHHLCHHLHWASQEHQPKSGRRGGEGFSVR